MTSIPDETADEQGQDAPVGEEPSEGEARGGLSARAIALAALSDRAGNVTAHLGRLLAQHRPSPADAALARELTLGTHRRQRTLDVILKAFCRPGQGAKTPQRVDQILRLGAYQVLFLQRVPEFAAVNESVALVGKRALGMRGFVNAMLRNIARAVSPEQPGRPPRDRDVLPIGPNCFRRFDRPIFADSKAQTATWLGETFSLPDDLAQAWLNEYKPLERVIGMAMHANARPPLILRVNTAAITVAEAVQRLAGQSVQALPHRNGISVVLTEMHDVTGLELFREGLVSPQDPMATSVVAAMDLKPGMRVVDLCSSPGGKTVHMAQRMGNQGTVIALDVSEEKLARVTANCARAGVSIVETMLAPRAAELVNDRADVVLVDAPCSNTGVLSRRCEARWRYTRRSVANIAQDQRNLLRLGAELVRSGGRLVYSTCSLAREENQQVVKDVLMAEPTLRKISEKVIMPSGLDDPTGWSDGGFFAVLGRS